MPWAKGQSGNPGGRPKGTAEIAELCRELLPAGVKRLAEIIEKSDNETAVIRALEVAFERGLGKPIQPIDTNASIDSLFSADEREALADAIRAAADEARGTPTAH